MESHSLVAKILRRRLRFSLRAYKQRGSQIATARIVPARIVEQCVEEMAENVSSAEEIRAMDHTDC